MPGGAAGSTQNPVGRFWAERGAEVQLDEDGFLRDPAHALYPGNPHVVATSALGAFRCAALLGEPGSGKSTACRAPAVLPPACDHPELIDLNQYGSEDRFVREVLEGPIITKWLAGVATLGLILDSLDEAMARIPTIATVIAARIATWPAERLSLRVVCRSANWPSSLGEALRDRYPDMAVMELLPLRRADAASLASQWCDGGRLVEAACEVGAGPLAARPLTLQFLARGFAEHGEFASSGSAIYRSGLRALCDEHNAIRREGGLTGGVTVEEHLGIARRLAAVTVFGGRSTIWTGPASSADPEDLCSHDLLGGAEPSPRGRVVVTPRALEETTRTGLFTTRGQHRLGWAHATFADFLAADWVAANGLTPEQARPLFLAPDGHCWPEASMAATWAVAIDPGRFGFLAHEDPEAFATAVDLPDEHLRSVVVDGMLDRADELLHVWFRHYAGLSYEGLSERLRLELRSEDQSRRELAIEIASDCGLAELLPELEVLALDPEGASRDRIRAAWAIVRLSADDPTPALLSLVTDPAVRGEDPSDELLGVGLKACWPHAISTEAVLRDLAAPKIRNLTGSYAMFLQDLASGLTAEDLPAGLRWIEDQAPRLADYRLAAVANAVVRVAAQNTHDESVAKALARLYLLRARDHHGLHFDDLDRDRADLFEEAGPRRKVLDAAIALKPDSDAVFVMSGLTSPSDRLVRPEDLHWLMEQYAARPDDRPTVLQLFEAVFDVRRADHCDAALSLPTTHPLHHDLIASWVEPVRLDSPEAVEARAHWERFRAHRLPDPEPDEVTPEIVARLDQFDAGDLSGYWYGVRLLHVAPGSKYFNDEHDPDVTEQPRWAALDEELQARIIRASARYLETGACSPEDWIDDPTILHHPSESAYRAAVILLRKDPTALRALDDAVWVEWAPLLATKTTGSLNAAKWEDKEALLGHAETSIDTIRSWMLRRIRAAARADQRSWLGNEAKHLWDDQVATVCMDLVSTAGDDMLDEVSEWLIAEDFERIRPLLVQWLALYDEDPARWQLAMSALFVRDLERSWTDLRPQLERDLDKAAQVIGKVRYVPLPRRDLPERLTADIYLWLLAHFPPAEDPQFDDAHFVGPREELARWRDGLVQNLEQRGSLAAVAEIQRIISDRPDAPLKYSLVVARAALRRRQWQPTPWPQLATLAADTDRLLVHDEQDLLRAVIAGLQEIQQRLTGANPESHLLWDTHSHRPKTEEEMSDYLARQLQDRLSGRGIVVNREVQVRRSRPSGIGERTDLQVDAAVPGRGPSLAAISLPIEVKGAWNDGLHRDLEEQLVARYMRDLGARTGVFVVLWPDLESWTDATDARRKSTCLARRAEIEEGLVEQAARAAAAGSTVQVLNLDMSYRRPAPP